MPQNTETNSPTVQAEVDRQISEFLLRTCHDLRTPLRAVRSHTELLARSAPGGEATADHVRFIVEGAKSIENLIAGLAQYSIALQIDTSTFQPCGLQPLVRNAAAKLDSEMKSAEAQIAWDPLPRVFGNPDRLMDVFQHLIANSVQHRETPGARIHIASERKNGDWRIGVSDNGPGIDSAYLETVFLPFQRLNAKRRSGPGLGLAICRKIVERHGGRMWAESVANTGTTFYFTLPAAPEN